MILVVGSIIMLKLIEEYETINSPLMPHWSNIDVFIVLLY